MNILIIGGTRFIGKNLVKKFILNKHDITVISRKKGDIKGVNYIKMDKKEGLTYLSTFCKSFDLVFDFVLYKPEDLSSLDKIKFNRYIMISTTWIVKLSSDLGLDKLVGDFNPIKNISKLTQEYIYQKSLVENILIKDKFIKNAIILRLPIVLGDDDHTGRYDFYKSRILDDYPYLFINDQNNKVQITYISELIEAIYKWCLDFNLNSFTIWEALPNSSISLKDMVINMTKRYNPDKKNKVKDLSLMQIKNYYPKYLEYEPFWREYELKISEHNIFHLCNIKTSTFGTLKMDFNNKTYDEYRKDEIEVFKKI